MSSLHKSATIEKDVVMCTGRYIVRDEEEIEEIVIVESTFRTSKWPIRDGEPC